MMGLVQSMAILRFDLSWAFRRRCAFCTLWSVGSLMVSDMLVYLKIVDGEKEFVVERWVVEREVMSVARAVEQIPRRTTGFEKTLSSEAKA
jgi:hypothetical protein